MCTNLGPVIVKEQRLIVLLSSYIDVPSLSVSVDWARTVSQITANVVKSIIKDLNSCRWDELFLNHLLSKRCDCE